MTLDEIAGHVRMVPDFPKPGNQFRDLTPLLAAGAAFQATTAALAERAGGFDLIAGVEARGFLFGAALAHLTGHGLVIVRKPGKLPGTVLEQAYALEYGEEALQLQADALASGARVLLVDDVLATGGTLLAARALAEQLDAQVVGAGVLLEIGALAGRSRWGDAVPLHAALTL